MGESKFYAVQCGHTPGVYTSWKDCLDQIRGFKGAKFKSFSTAEDAQMFMSGKDPSLDPASSSYTAKFYGVRSGKVPGVYTDWASAELQVKGVQKPKVKWFPTREEAEAFVNFGATVAKEIESPPRSRIIQQNKQQNKQQHMQQSVVAASPPSPSTSPSTSPSPPAVATKPQLEEDNDDDELEVLPENLSVFVNRDADGVPPAKKRRLGSTGNLAERELNETPGPPDTSDKKTPTTARIRAPKSPVLRIWTDGSALSNGQSGSNAGVGVWFGDHDTRNISEPLAGPRQTNQRAELTAILRAIDAAPPHRDVQIFTDSQYAIKCVTVWHHTWIRNNWITSVGRPVENRDLVEQIVNKIAQRERAGNWTRFEWVKAHTGQNDGNSQADRLAVRGALLGREARG